MPGDISGDVAAVQRIAVVPSILEVACKVTGMGFAGIARITDEQWIACAVRDEIGYGVPAGAEFELRATLCDAIRGHRSPIIIEHVAEDPIFRHHDIPRLYGFQSYISAPIIRRDGDFFGTLFAVDRVPTRLSNKAAITSFQLFAQLIALELDGDKPTAPRS